MRTRQSLQRGRNTRRVSHTQDPTNQQSPEPFQRSARSTTRMLSALSAPESWNQADVLRLHRMIGNRAVGSLIGSGRTMNPTGTGIHQDPSRLNTTGLPDRLKAGIETLSGMSLDEVRVHRNTARPAQLDALAYTKGVEIYVGPGQEHHLPHEAWHVVQQAQGRVKQTLHA